jgi:hypothetical protein
VVGSCRLFKLLEEGGGVELRTFFFSLGGVAIFYLAQFPITISWTAFVCLKSKAAVPDWNVELYRVT